MKLAKLVTITTIAIIGSVALNAQAIEFSKGGGKILSQRTWATGGAKGEFTQSQNNSSAMTDARLQDVTGYEKSNAYVYGNHWWSISNTEDQDQQYEVIYKLCADEASEACIFQETHFTVYARGHAVDSASSTVVNYFEKPGIYTSSAFTEVNGQEHDSTKRNATVTILHR